MPTKLYKISKLMIVFGVLNIFFISCKENNIGLKQIKAEQIEINQQLDVDSSYIKTTEPYKAELQHEINRILCYNPIALSRKESDLESSLGNIYADICFEKADSIFNVKTGKSIDFALFNYGGIRNVIPKGNITVKNIFELMPFENKLVIVKLTGTQTKNLFSYLEERKEAHPISQLKLEMKNKKLSKVLIQNKFFDPSKEYYVLTHDYLQHGGDNMVFFKDPINLFNTEYKVRDAIIDYLNSIDTLQTKLDGRFIKIN